MKARKINLRQEILKGDVNFKLGNCYVCVSNNLDSSAVFYKIEGSQNSFAKFTGVGGDFGPYNFRNDIFLFRKFSGELRFTLDNGIERVFLNKS